MWTRSTQTPHKDDSAAGFFSVGKNSVSNPPIWLVEATNFLQSSPRRMSATVFLQLTCCPGIVPGLTMLCCGSRLSSDADTTCPLRSCLPARPSFAAVAGGNHRAHQRGPDPPPNCASGRGLRRCRRVSPSRLRGRARGRNACPLALATALPKTAPDAGKRSMLGVLAFAARAYPERE